MAGVLSFGAAVLFGWATLATWWLGYRADRREHADGVLPYDLADQLAEAVREQWEAETRMRRLSAPYPYSLPLSWGPADAELADAWADLQVMAQAIPDGPPADEFDWARGSAGLTGQDGEIAQLLLRRLPTRRLVVLGAAGTGKTVLLIRLLLVLLEERRRDDGSLRVPGASTAPPVPVLFSLASWNPREQGLRAWLAAQLAVDYQGLGDMAPGLTGRRSRARLLLNERLILPILDGLDEMPEESRRLALDAINQELPMGHGLVLASRPEEFRAAAVPPSGLPLKLAGAAAIELSPVRAAEAAAYLRCDAGGEGTASAARWEPVVAQLTEGRTVLAQTLTTPLMLSLARTVYNPRPGEQAGALPDPGDLCDPVRFPDRTAIEAHLFNAYIPAAYRPHECYPCRWSPEQAEAALGFLAQHLQHDRGGSPDLAWWRLHEAAPRFSGPVGPRLLLGIAGLMGVLPMLIAAGLGALALLYGLALAAFAVLTIGPARAEPSRAMRWSWSLRRLGAGLVAGFCLGFAVSWPFRGMASGGYGDIVTPTVVGLGVGVVAALAGSGDAAAADPTAVGPAALLHSDQRVYRTFALVGTTAGVVLIWPFIFGFLGMLGLWTPIGLAVGLLAALAYAVPFGLVYASARAAWGAFTRARWIFAIRKRCPRDLMAFLADAHERRGVLRQQGAVYQFRHRTLQDHLSERTAQSGPAEPPGR
jgi:hypothetical protein